MSGRCPELVATAGLSRFNGLAWITAFAAECTVSAVLLWPRVASSEANGEVFAPNFAALLWLRVAAFGVNWGCIILYGIEVAVGGGVCSYLWEAARWSRLR